MPGYLKCIFTTIFAIALVFAVILLESLLPDFRGRNSTDSRSQELLWNISNAFIITTKTDATKLASDIKKHLHIKNITVFHAESRLDLSSIPLATRDHIENGRHNHMQISTKGMLGCLKSHVKIWTEIKNLRLPAAAVFEEDAAIDSESAKIAFQLWSDTLKEPWDILLLQTPEIPISGIVDKVGQFAATCKRLSKCTWYGTRGYVLTKEGSGILLKHAEPAYVQVDALINLVARYEPGFHMFWTTTNAVKQNQQHQTTVQDLCIKCFLPTDTESYIIIAAIQILILLLVFALGIFSGSTRFKAH